MSSKPPAMSPVSARRRAHEHRHDRDPPVTLAGSPWAIPWLARKFCAIIVPSTVPAMLPRRLPAHHPAKAGTGSGNAAEQPFHRAGLAHFRARGEARERLRILGGVRALRFGHFGAQLLEQHPALLWREPGEGLDVRLLDGFRRRGLQHVAVSRERLLVLGRFHSLALVGAPRDSSAGRKRSKMPMVWTPFVSDDLAATGFRTRTDSRRRTDRLDLRSRRAFARACAASGGDDMARRQPGDEHAPPPEYSARVKSCACGTAETERRARARLSDRTKAKQSVSRQAASLPCASR